MFFNLFFILFSGSFVFFLYKFYISVCGKPKILTISLFFCIHYIIYTYIGSVVLNVVQLSYENSLGMYARPDIFLKLWFFCTLGFFMIVLGILLSHLILDSKFLFKKIQNDMLLLPYKNSSGIQLLIIVFLVISVLFLFFYRQKLGGVLPIEYVFSNKTAAELALLRSNATNNFQGKLYRYYIFIEDIPLILCILLSFLKNKNKMYRILFFMLLCYNIFVSLMTLQKGPLFHFLILLMIIYFFKTGKINRKILFYFTCFASVVVVILYVFFMGQGGKGFFRILSLALDRLLTGQISPFYWYIKYVEDFGYLYGRSFPNPAGIFPFEHFRLTVEIMNYAMGSLGEIVGSMPTVFLGEIYINFGFILMLLGAFFFGFILGSLDILFISYLSKNKNVFISTIYIFLIKYFSQFTGGGFFSIFADLNLFISLFTIYFLYLISNLWSIKNDSCMSCNVSSCV